MSVFKSFLGGRGAMPLPINPDKEETTYRPEYKCHLVAPWLTVLVLRRDEMIE